MSNIVRMFVLVLMFAVSLALATFPTSPPALAAPEPDESSQATKEASSIPDAISHWTPKGSQSFVAGETLPDLAAGATYPCQGAKRYQWQGSDGVGVRLTWVNCRAKGDAWQFERLFWKSQNHGFQTRRCLTELTPCNSEARPQM